MATTKHASMGSTDRWENDGGRMLPERPLLDDLQIELKRHGVVPVQLIMFDCGGYRYSNARDAIAAAKRLSRPVSE
ncbi:hypothetical protein [Sphingomonas alba]|uniref:Uncharacterized protein n=1 Tax=Sphingomonas alba TaxID=2908208 RepID=A0ABT0RJ97_9SPHN|nr:hypothetical protein [Sphingomonas alba]MCL6682657.1 hypothetical protein [Sphingomonas alba]